MAFMKYAECITVSATRALRKFNIVSALTLCTGNNSSTRCLQHVIEGCGPSFSKYITTELLKLLFQALDHTNRFVRETGYQVFASLVRLGVSKGIVF